MPRWPSTLRWRLTLWYIVLLGVPLIAFAVGGYVLFARTLYGRTDRFIGDALTAFSREIGAERRAGPDILSAMRSTADEVRFRDLHIAILDSAAQLVAMTPQSIAETRANVSRPDIDTWIAGAFRGRDLGRAQAITVRRPDGGYRVISAPLVFAGHQFALTGTASLADIEEMLARMRQVFIIVIPLLIILAATGGYFVTARSLAPVSSMAARAAEISTANLADRLPVAGSDELVTLAVVVNDLLDRLEASFSHQRRFMADASHELRTPTAILRTEADVTLSQDHRTEDDYRASVGVMRDAARRLTRIVDDLFLLARTDAGQLPARREPLYLEDIVEQATRGVRPLAAARGVRVELRHVTEAPFEGDEDQLARLLLNLLDNAIKHSPADSVVEVALQQSGAEYEIRVIDAGEGIPPEAHERVFERFFRVDSARSQAERPPADRAAVTGAGLGLAIARRIAELHGGRLELVESRPGRTEFRLTLPALAPSPA